MNITGNLDVTRRAIRLFHTGRVELMRAMLAEDVIWRIPRTHPLAADIEGVENVIEFFQRVQGETDGTFGAEVLDLVAGDGIIICHMRVRAERRGKKLDQKVINIWRLRASDGKVIERELFLEDQIASAEFWAY